MRIFDALTDRCMKKPLFLLICCVLTICTGFGQKAAPSTFYSPEFKWRVSIPAGFDTLSAESQQQMNKAGQNALEKTVGEKIETEATSIFTLHSGLGNYFQADYQSFDPAKDGDFNQMCNSVNQLLYETFKTQMPNAKMDSASSTTTVDGLVFQTFTVNIHLGILFTTHVRVYSHLFGTKDFTVNITTMEPVKEKALMESWMNSTFEK